MYMLIKSLINKIGGKRMETLETKCNTGLITGVMSTLLVVGNLGVLSPDTALNRADASTTI